MRCSRQRICCTRAARALFPSAAAELQRYAYADGRLSLEIPSRRDDRWTSWIHAWRRSCAGSFWSHGQFGHRRWYHFLRGAPRHYFRAQARCAFASLRLWSRVSVWSWWCAT